MTETPTTAPKTKAQQIAELLGVELMPWQAAIFDAYLAGERMVYAGGRQGGRSTVRALADLAAAMRNPPAQAAPVYAVLDEAFTEPYLSLPLMLPCEPSPFPRVYLDYVAPARSET